MNERIDQLAEQAGIQMFEDRAFGWSVIAGTDHNVQRFAELIVRDCLRICQEGTATQTTCAGAADLIKQHFGVAE